VTTLLLLLPLALAAFQPKQPDELLRFFGFSADGKSFAWTVAGPDQKAQAFKVATVGSAEPQTIALDKPGFAKVKAMIKAKGFSAVRHIGPTGLKLDAKLGATPPKLTLIRGATRMEVPVGERAYTGGGGPVVLGGSNDGKFVVIVIPPTTIYGPANKADFLAAFVVAVPPGPSP
jgi:hypothetical protein